MVKFAHNIFDCFRNMLSLDVENYIKVTVELTKSHKVVVGRMVKFHTDKVVLS